MPAIDLQFETTTEPAAADLAVVDAGLGAFIETAVDTQGVVPIACFARDREGTVIAGLRGRCWGQVAEVQQLWVEAPRRRTGIGQRLLQSFEDEARRRGVELVYLDTFSWQAPAFYQRVGYTIALATPGFPGSATKYTLHKRLVAETPDE